MARSPDLRHLALVALAAVLLCDAPAPASAAPPTAAEKAARKQQRQEQRRADKAGKRTDAKPDAQTDTKAAKKAGQQPTPATAPAAHAAAPATGLPPCPPDNTLTWRSFGAGFLLTWCTGCHSSHLGADARQDAPVGVDFDTLARFKPHAGVAHERAVLEAHAFLRDPNAGSPMPPAGLPPDADRERFAQWIACGAP